MFRLALFFLFSLQLLYSDQVFIRSFDLGGTGLKTAVLAYDTESKQLSWIEEQTQLGKCPTDQEVKEWIRRAFQEKLHKNLDEEVQRGYFFSFSLAGLGKLRSLPLSTTNMSILCDLPKDKVVCIDDGAAHLIGSLYSLGDKLPKGSIWNFGIGTGISLGHAKDNNTISKLSDLYKLFGKAPWNTIEPTTGLSVWKVCSAKSFDRILEKNQGEEEASFLEFAKAWKSYLTANFFQTKDLPSAIIFTGGHIDTYQGRFIKALSNLDIPVPLFQGPKNAGLLGAAFHAMTYNTLSESKWFEAIAFGNKKEVLQYLESKIDVNQFDALGNSPLSIAIEKDLVDIAKILIQHGAWVNHPNFSRVCPLSLAVQKGNMAMVQLLLDSGAEINDFDCFGRTALFFAREKEEKKIEDLLLSKGATL